MDEFTHRLSSRGTEAPQLRCCHYSCCMLKRLRLTTPLFPPPRSLLQVFPTPKNASVLFFNSIFRLYFFFFFFLLGGGGGGYSSVYWSVFDRFSSRHIHLFVCCLNFSQECRARQSVCFQRLPSQLITGCLSHYLSIIERGEKRQSPCVARFFSDISKHVVLPERERQRDG